MNQKVIESLRLICTDHDRLVDFITPVLSFKQWRSKGGHRGNSPPILRTKT